jgi:DNA-binding CsgD family transcriptional regulator
VPDAEERCGYTRDDLLRSVVVAIVTLPDPPAVRRLLDRELRTAGEDPVRDWVLREFRRQFPSEDEPAAPEIPEAEWNAADLVLNTPLDHPWLPRIAHALSSHFYRDDTGLAARIAARGAEAARLRVERTEPSRAYLSMSPEADVLVADTAVQGALCAAGDWEGAVRILEAMPRDVPPRQLAGYIDWNLSDELHVLGRYEESIVTAQRGLNLIVEPHRAPMLWTGMMTQLAECQLAMGRWGDAETTLGRCDQMVLDEEQKSQAHALAGLLACWRGRLDEAGRLLERVEAASRPLPEPPDLVRPRWLAAELAAARNQLDVVRGILAPMWSDPDWEIASTHLWQPLLLELRMEVDLVLEVRGAAADQARERIEACRTVAAKLRRVGGAGVAWDLHVRAELALADGRVEPVAWQEACAAWEKIGRAVDAAWARLRQARSLAGNRQRDEASALVAGVRALAIDLGAIGLRDAAEAMGTRIAGTGRRSGDVPFGLTSRELEVLRLVSLGRSNAQIAQDLFISPKTVSVHVSSLLAKLQVSSRTEAVVAAQRRGLLQPLMQP